MKEQEKAKIQILDPDAINGTVQHLLMDANINQMPYADAVYYLLKKTLDEKAYFERTTNAMMTVMRSHNLFDEINWALELEEKI